MKIRKIYFRIAMIILMLVIIFISMQLLNNFSYSQDDVITDTSQSNNEKVNKVTPTKKITELEEGLSTVRYDDNYAFDEFISRGGASSDAELISFISQQLLSSQADLSIQQIPFGCSTLSVAGNSGHLFGRNFDWQNLEALIIQSHSKGNYASIATVNLDFVASGSSIDINELPDEIRNAIAMYIPLDGMNEKGLAVSVNMIQDDAVIDQNTAKPDLTTTTAIRLLLNEAANVDEAIQLLEQYDLHSSMNMMVHFSLTDLSGKSVVVEYVDQVMHVIETPAVTNFYLCQGEKYGIGTSQSHERYEILMNAYNNDEVHSMTDMRDILDSVSKDNFNEFESTEWSVVFNLDTREAKYYHRENYKNSYSFKIES